MKPLKKIGNHQCRTYEALFSGCTYKKMPSSSSSSRLSLDQIFNQVIHNHGSSALNGQNQEHILCMVLQLIKEPNLTLADLTPDAAKFQGAHQVCIDDGKPFDPSL